MANIKKSITELVGHTPLVELTNYNKKNQLKGTLVGKLELRLRMEFSWEPLQQQPFMQQNQ